MKSRAWFYQLNLSLLFVSVFLVACGDRSAKIQNHANPEDPTSPRSSSDPHSPSASLPSLVQRTGSHEAGALSDDPTLVRNPRAIEVLEIPSNHGDLLDLSVESDGTVRTLDRNYRLFRYAHEGDENRPGALPIFEFDLRSTLTTEPRTSANQNLNLWTGGCGRYLLGIKVIPELNRLLFFYRNGRNVLLEYVPRSTQYRILFDNLGWTDGYATCEGTVPQFNYAASENMGVS